VINLILVTTVPDSLAFFHGHMGYLRAHGFYIHAVSSPGPLADQFSARAQIPVCAIPMERSISPRRDWVALWRLRRLFRTLRPDIVHSHTPKAGLLGTLAARLAGVPVVLLSVFGLPQMTRTGLTRHLLNMTTWLACLAAHRVWCDSFSMREYLAQKRLCPDSKIIVLGHGSVAGVEAQEVFSPILHGAAARAEIRAKYSIPSAALVIGFVGRIVCDKGMHELAGAWRRLREQYADAHLLVVGKFEDQDPLSPADELLFRTDPRIHLAGHQTEVAPYYAAMDIFTMPSYREGFGITNIEAAAMALPVVSTRIPGCVDSVQDEITGMLVPPRDIFALTKALRRYADDSLLRYRHGHAGRARILRDFVPGDIYSGLMQEYVHLWLHRK
jgi:glycosyltransferase involved in cell wall biosynthesis